METTINSKYQRLGSCGWLRVGNRHYWIESRTGRVPEVWVHARPGDLPALLYVCGTSLQEGTTDSADLEYLRMIIADRLTDD